MIIKLFDREYGEFDYIKANKYDEHIQDKADFFFDRDYNVDYESNNLKEETAAEVLVRYNKTFNENLSLEQFEAALAVTDHGECGQTIDRYIRVFEALGYKVESLLPKEDLEIIIER